MANVTYHSSGDVIEMTADKDYAAGDYFRLEKMKCGGVVVADTKQNATAVVRIKGVVKVKRFNFTPNIGDVVGVTVGGDTSSTVGGGSGELFLGWVVALNPPTIGGGLVLLGGPQL